MGRHGGGSGKKVKDRKVSEMMTKKVITVNEDSSLMECVDHMLKKMSKDFLLWGKTEKSQEYSMRGIYFLR